MPESRSFPRSTRLLTPNDFKRVFKKARKLNYREFTVYICRNGMDNPRLGLAVSKKAAKKAVSRNLIKRVIRESFRLNQVQLRGWDLVFVAKPPAKDLTSAQLHHLLLTIWKRIAS